MSEQKDYDKEYFLKYPNDKTICEWKLFYNLVISDLRETVGDNLRICDIGCGLGAFLQSCDMVGWETFGLDISDYAIKDVREKTKAKLAVGDVQKEIPFVGDFDSITCFDVIEHLGDPKRALINIHRKLKKGGVLVLTTPNTKSDFLKAFSRWPEDKTHISLKSPKEWNTILRKLGFRIIIFRTLFPVLQQRDGFKAMIGKCLAKIGLASTLIIFAVKE